MSRSTLGFLAMELGDAVSSEKCCEPTEVDAVDKATASASQPMQITIKRLKDPEPCIISVPSQDTVGDVMDKIQETLGISPDSQRLVYGKVPLQDGSKHLADYDIVDGSTLTLLIIQQDKSLITWDISGNPDKDMLVAEDPCTATCPSMRTDYINLLTDKPIKEGVHYIQFIMHHIGDEQWCGVTPNQAYAGRQTSGRSLKQGWFYYAGRIPYGGGKSSRAALMVNGSSSCQAEGLTSSGDVIGILLDLKVGGIAFDLNGTFQGVAKFSVPCEPLWILTHLDTPEDKVELKQRPPQSAPKESHHAIASSG